MHTEQSRQAAEHYTARYGPQKGRREAGDTEEGVGRGGGIRTHDPSVPNAVRYQTALRPDTPLIIRDGRVFVKCISIFRSQSEKSKYKRWRSTAASDYMKELALESPHQQVRMRSAQAVAGRHPAYRPGCLGCR